MENEKRLIDANALKSQITRYHMSLTPRYISNLVNAEIGDVIDIIDEAPTIDAVEVVRCGKCLYYSETTGKDSGKPCGYGVCTKHFHITNIVTNEDFCSFGKRRADAKMDGEN